MTPKRVGFAVVAALLFWLIAAPVFAIFWGSIRDSGPGVPGNFTTENFATAFSRPGFWAIARNTAVFALGATSIAFGMGTYLSWLTERTNTRFRGLIYLLVIAPLAIPGILSAIAWQLFLSPEIGILNAALSWAFGDGVVVNGYSLPAMIWVFGVDSVSLPFLLMAAAFRSMDPSLEEAAVTAGASVRTTFRRITLPLMKPAAYATVLIVLIRCIETFEVPAVLGLPGRIAVFSTLVWAQSAQFPSDFNMAAVYSVAYLFVAAALLVLYMRAMRSPHKYRTVSGKGFRASRMALGRSRNAHAVFALSFLALSTGVPVFVMLYSSLMPFYSPPSLAAIERMSFASYLWVFENARILASARTNLVVGVASAGAAVLLAAIIAWIVQRTETRGRAWLDVAAFAPIAIPGVVMGIAYIWLYLNVPIPVYGTVWILILAFVAKYLTFALRAVSSSLAQLHPDLEDAAAASGAGWLFSFRRITLPLISGGILAGFLYVLSLTMKVVAMPALLVGPGSSVIPVTIFDLWTGGSFSHLNALGVVLCLSLLAISVISHFVSRKLSGAVVSEAI